jgi:hypothetical protein
VVGAAVFLMCIVPAALMTKFQGHTLSSWLDGTYLYCGSTALSGPKGLWRISRRDVGL